MKLIIVVIGVLSLFLTSCKDGKQDLILEPVSGIKEERLEEVKCWFSPPKSQTSTTCFYMIVPQDVQNIEGLWIKFPVIKITSSSVRSTKSPVLHLGGGGPGNPMGFWPNADVSWIWTMYRGFAVSSDRDLYIIDPRGVGHTEPALSCFEYADMIEEVLGVAMEVQEENVRSLQAYDQCRDRLASKRVDFSFYNSLAVAQDVEALRKVLGIEQWNLYGVSYGTRYAQIIAREYPLSVETMILDAATFPDINYTERSGQAYLQTFERLFSYCDQTKSCNSKFGDVRSVFWDLVDELNKNPLYYEITHPFTENWFDVAITGSRFLNAYFSALYDADNYAHLPEVISSLSAGELGPFENILHEWLYFILDPDYGDAAAISHYCHEEAPFVSLDKTIADLQVLPESIRKVAVAEMQATFKQCEQWSILPASNLESKAVVTDVPTLFLHGALDPVLPVEDLENQITTFKNSDQIIFEDLSHTVVGVHPCGMEISRAFFDHKLSFRDYVSCDL